MSPRAAICSATLVTSRSMVEDLKSIQLVIAGASVRAAAQAAQAANLRLALAADLFGDIDLLSCVPEYAHLKPGYRNLADVLQSRKIGERPGACWLYTGALENHPHVVSAVPIRLLGNSAATLTQVRDPWRLATCLSQADLPIAKLSRTPNGRNLALPWLRKPFKSAAGLGVERVPDRSSDAVEPDAAETHYYQEWIAGRSFGALYIAAGGECALVGVAEQLIGPQFGAPGQFQYAGSIGPVPLTTAERWQWQRIGQCLVKDFGLTGLFGVDAVLSEGRLFVVEVNPRYTAAAEVLERSLGVSTVRMHVEACLTKKLPSFNMLPDGSWTGKRIIYAERPVHIRRSIQDAIESLPSVAFRFADVPAVDSRIPRGAPIATVLAGPLPSQASVVQALTQGIAAMRQRLV